MCAQAVAQTAARPEAVAETAVPASTFSKVDCGFQKWVTAVTVPEMGDRQKQWKNIWSTGGFGLSPISGAATH